MSAPIRLPDVERDLAAFLAELAAIDAAVEAAEHARVAEAPLQHPHHDAA